MKRVIDVVLISDAKTEELKKVTKDAINSLTKADGTFYVYVIESNSDITYNEYNDFKWKHKVTTIHPEVPFGYHRYLNIGRKAGKSKYVALCNNDLTFERDWANVIIDFMETNPIYKSVSPWCPQTQGDNSQHKGKIYEGYRVRGELAGWCIFQQRDIYDTYPGGKLDENFEFWFCDNDYALTLETNNIKHALVCDSVVNHHDGNLGKTGITLDSKNQARITMGQQKTFTDKWNK